MMIKLYRRHNDGLLAYHEAWTSDREITEHWGTVGTTGEQRTHKMYSSNEKLELENVLNGARLDGYNEIDIDEHKRLIVEYSIRGMGTSPDLDKRHRLEKKLNEKLGWTGLGNCDGGSIGSGSMEVCCFVVDFEIAKTVIEQDLAGTEFSNFSRIFDEDQE